MAAIFIDTSTKQGQKKRLATKVRNLDSTNRKQRAYEKKEAIENIYSMKIERSTNQRDQRRAKRNK